MYSGRAWNLSASAYEMSATLVPTVIAENDGTWPSLRRSKRIQVPETHDLTSSSAAAWPAVGLAGDAGSAAAFAEGLEDLQTLSLAGVRPARNFS